jgi:sortase A
MSIGILITLSVLLYPAVSDYVNSRSQSRAVAHYIGDVAAMEDENMRALLEAAHDYNRSLFLKQDRFRFSEEETAEYREQLNTGRGVMGILVIDKIDVNLPVYHGTDQDTLQVGLGHMQGTSLPVGGAGTHAFITGHRGVPSSKLLTDLNKLTEGDTFTLYVMGEALTYQIDQILVVEPHETEALSIDPDMDYCTLVTCTPYGVNSHRLLARGRRMENAANPGWETIYAGARWLDKPIVIMIFMIPVIPVLFIYIIIRCRKIQKEGMRR